MEINENLVTEEVTENVEQTTEQTPVKTYTQEEVDAMMGKRVARTEAKIRKEYDRKYGQLEEVLKAGTGKQDVDEMTDTFRQFYQKKGIKMPEKPDYTAKDIEVLAKAEADEIIRSGFDEVVEETDRLTALGVGKMTAREKEVFRVLADHRQKTERGRELSKIGVTEDVYNSEDFKSFAAKFNATTPIRDIYDIYAKTQPKKDIKPMGSMKQSQNTGVKDYYTPEEIERLTMQDLDDPRVWEAVRRSMTGR
jgi:hypothetical protein